MVVQALGVVNDLKSQNKNLSYLYMVSGLLSEGDGGGGLFWWNPVSTAPDDNVNVIQVTGVTTGRWVRIFDQTAGVPASRQLTINGVTYDLSADRTWNVENIYNSDGTLTSNRTVYQDGYNLKFDTAITVDTIDISNGGNYYSVYLNIDAYTEGSGDYNVGIGYGVGTFGESNVGIGYYALNLGLGSDNTGIGSSALSDLTTGNGNIGIGSGSASGIATGSYNTIIGSGFPYNYFPSNMSNNIVLADGQGHIRFRDDNVSTILPRLAGTGTRMVVASSTGALSTQPIPLVSGYVPITRTLTINGTAYDLSADRTWSVGTVTSISTTGPITGGTITGSGTIGITQSGASADGYLSSTDWTTFNNKQSTISLTTTGSSGAATFISNTLNIPNYTLSGLGGVPTSRSLTINGTAYDLSDDRSWSVGTVTSVGLSMPSAFTVTNSPVTGSGSLTVAGAGTTSQYIDGTGALQSFPSLTGFVPYTGATTNVNLGEYGLSSGYVSFDTTPTYSGAVGRLIWNNTDGTLDLGLKGGSSVLQIGQEQVAMVINGSGSTLNQADYSAVRIIGAQGSRLQVGLAQANSDPNSVTTLGLVTETIPSSQEGFITTFGLVRDINTTGSIQGETWADGQTVYLSPTTAGGLTNVKPVAPNHLVRIGTIVSAHATTGSIFVDVVNGYELDELHDVYTPTYVNNGLLYRDTSANLWKTATIQTILGYNIQPQITLTTSGSSGASTFISNTLNIPTYTLSGLGGVPTTTTLTINGTSYDLSTNRSWSVGTVTSVGISMPSAFNVTNSPVTGSGTLTVTAAGLSTQYIRGDGTLADFPSGPSGGGASVSYYLNGSVNQGTFGGSTYYQMNKTPVIGTGTNFTRNSNGYIAEFITDSGDPNQLLIPGGNWNFEFYMSSSSAGGSPSFYVELYKYNGTTFTLISSGSGSPEVITNGTSVDAYYTSLAVPETVLTTSDRLAIRVYVTNDGRTITMYTEDNKLAQVITTFTTGITAINNLTKQVQYLATGTSGTDFNIVSSTDTHTFNLPVASSTNTGKLSNSDWITFNAKQNALTFGNLTEATSSILTISGGTGSVIGTGTSIQVKQSSGSQSGYLSSTDWSTFNNKQAAITLTTSGTTGAATFTSNTLNIPQYQGQITLTTTGTSGAASLVGNTLNIPQYQSVLTLGNLTEATSSVLTITGGSNAVIGSGTSIQVSQSSGTQSGFLSSTDWTTFNNKQNALTNPIEGAGTRTINYVPRFASGTTIQNSGITDNGTVIEFLRSIEGGIATFSNNVTVQSLFVKATSPRITLTNASGSGLGYIEHNASNVIYNATVGAHVFNQAASFTGSVTATSLVKSGGTSTQYLMADGSTSTLTNPVTGTGATNELAYWTSTSAIGTLTTSTYPSLTELSYVKGVTSAIQTQLNAKEPTLTKGNLTESTSSVLTISGGSNAVIGSGTSIQVKQASGTQSGYLSSTDWTTFNNKQAALTNPVTGTGTTNYIPKFTSSSAIGNSAIFDNGGNIGINNTNSYNKLDIVQVGSNNAVSGVGLKIVSDAGNSASMAFSQSARGTAIIGMEASGAVPCNFVIGTDVTGAFLFKKGLGGTDLSTGTTQMALDASGNLGLGVTPSAWGSSYRSIEVGALGASFFSSTSGNNTWLTANAYFDGSNWKYAATNTASAFNLSGGNAGWYTAPSGTAGNAITFTQAMTLNASGNLSIGNTNDTYKLDVNGTGRFTETLRVQSSTTWANINIVGSSTTQGGQVDFYGSTVRYGTIVGEYESAGNGKLQFRTWTGSGTIPLTALSIASTGAATFSSSVTASDFKALNGSIYTQYIYDGMYSTGTDLYIHSQGAYNTRFYTNGSERMRITSGGNVGIGTTSPAYKLDVNGIVGANGIYSLGGNGLLAWNQYNNEYWRLNTTSANDLTFDKGGSIKMEITSGGNVLINTTTDDGSTKLQVNGAIKTSAPSGGTAKPWKLGKRVAPTGTHTESIEVEIDGTLYYLMAAVV